MLNIVPSLRIGKGKKVHAGHKYKGYFFSFCSHNHGDLTRVIETSGSVTCKRCLAKVDYYNRFKEASNDESN